MSDAQKPMSPKLRKALLATAAHCDEWAALGCRYNNNTRYRYWRNLEHGSCALCGAAASCLDCLIYPCREYKPRGHRTPFRDTPNLTPRAQIAWFRAAARELREMAKGEIMETIESTEKREAAIEYVRAKQEYENANKRWVDAEEAEKEALTQMRLAAEKIHRLLSHDEVVVLAEKGVCIHNGGSCVNRAEILRIADYESS